MTNINEIKIQLLEEISNKIQAEINSENMAKGEWHPERVIAFQDAQIIILKKIIELSKVN
jgi:hypothetical protein